jgi:transcriptional regulator with XRE-family HTH domain
MEKQKHDSYHLHLRKQNIRHIIGSQVRDARLRRGISQMDLALELGIDQNYISKVENGKINISIESLMTICYYLDCYFQIEDKEDAKAGKLSPLMRVKNRFHIKEENDSKIEQLRKFYAR